MPLLTILVNGLYDTILSFIIKQNAFVLAKIFCEEANSNRMSTVEFLTDSFCREQSKMKIVPPAKNSAFVKNGSEGALRSW